MLSSLTNITGTDLSIFNASFVESTIDGRMKESKCNTFDDYIACLNNDTTEIDRLKKALNNNYSLFFRNTLTFSFLENHILPLLVKQKMMSQSREIRIWSAACAAGQEAYSVAMLCDEFSKLHHPTVRFTIFATDISADELQKARRGTYSEMNVKNISYERVNNYLTRVGDVFKVKEELNHRVDFSHFDLLSEDCICPSASIFGSFDIIFCANLLFYYRPEIQEKIVHKLNQCLTPGGWLIVGDAEKEIVESYTDYSVYKYFTVLQKPAAGVVKMNI